MEAQTRVIAMKVEREKKVGSKYILKVGSIRFLEDLCTECVRKHRLKDGFRSLALGGC